MTIPYGFTMRTLENVAMAFKGTGITRTYTADWTCIPAGIGQRRFQGTKQWFDPNGRKDDYENSYSLSRLSRAVSPPIPIRYVDARGIFYAEGDLLSLYTYGNVEEIREASRFTSSEYLGWLPYTEDEAFDENLINRSVLRAYAKLDHRQVAMAVTAGEGKETLQLLRLRKLAQYARKPFKQLVKDFGYLHRSITNSWKRSRLRKTTSILDFASNAWLELRYGWRPLMYEVAEYRELLRSGIKKFDDSQFTVVAVEKSPVIRGTRSYDVRSNGVADPVNWRNYTLIDLEYDLEYEWRDKIATSIRYRSHALSAAANAGIALGLTKSNLPEILWELTPYSFVLDWFVDTGIWLQAMKPKPGVTVLAALTTKKRRCDLKKVTITNGDVEFLSELPESFCETLKREEAPRRSALPTINPATYDLFYKLDSLGLLWNRLSKIAGSYKRL